MASSSITNLQSEDDDANLNYNALKTKLSTNVKDKICRVCGDSAIGYNFSVLTCESCKAFFRRNANKTHEMKCQFAGKCNIDAISRRFCKYCRIQRCFQLGMKKECIMQVTRRPKRARIETIPDSSGYFEVKKLLKQIESDGENITVSKKLLINLVKRSKSRVLTECECECTCGFYPSGTKFTTLIPLPDQNQQQLSIETSEPTTEAIKNQQMVTRNSDNWCTQLRTKIIQKIPDEFNDEVRTAQPTVIFSNESSSYASLAMEPTNSKSFPTGTESAILNAFRKLDYDDQSLLQELAFANEILKQPLDISANQSTTEELTLLDVVRITDLALRRIISMAKQLSLFNNLTNEDRIAVLKGSCSELLILRGVMVFDSTKKVWNHHIHHGINAIEIKLDVLKRSKELQHYEEHKKFLTTFNEKWRQNEYVMLLLIAITLFCPNRCNVRDAEKLQASKNRYCALLERYLMNLYASKDARKQYYLLLEKLDELTQLSQGLLRIYHGLNTSDIDPLLMELFDLSKH